LSSVPNRNQEASRTNAEGGRIIGVTVPVCYFTGTIHSPGTGAPTAHGTDLPCSSSSAKHVPLRRL
jgi:hypothetical protein